MSKFRKQLGEALQLNDGLIKANEKLMKANAELLVLNQSLIDQNAAAPGRIEQCLQPGFQWNARGHITIH